MIPAEVEAYLAGEIGDIFRENKRSAEEILRSLGVDLNTEFAEFYLKYQGGFGSPRPIAELIDIEGPQIPNMPREIEYVRDRYELPEQYLPLTTDESEGMYLYNKDDGAVYDMDFYNLPDLLAGKLKPRWPTFNEFLVWYFTPGETSG